MVETKAIKAQPGEPTSLSAEQTKDLKRIDGSEVTNLPQVQSMVETRDDLVRGGASTKVAEGSDSKLSTQTILKENQVEAARTEMNVELFQRKIEKDGVKLEGGALVFPEGVGAELVAKVLMEFHSRLRADYVGNVYPKIESGVNGENAAEIANMIERYYSLSGISENIKSKIVQFIENSKSKIKASELLKISDNVSISFTSNKSGVVSINPVMNVQVGGKSTNFDSPALVLRSAEGRLIDNNSGKLYSGASSKDVGESILFN